MKNIIIEVPVSDDTDIYTVMELVNETYFGSSADYECVVYESAEVFIRSKAEENAHDDEPEDRIGEKSGCSKCGLDIEFIDPTLRYGWWDRGGNFACPKGGYHEAGE